jgi:hypothetical protein
MAPEPTNLDALPVPAALQADPLPGSREQRIHERALAVSPQWWDRQLVQRGLPGGPLAAHEVGSASGNPSWQLACDDLFALAGELENDDAILRLLWHALAWNEGRSSQLLDAIADHREIVVMALRDAIHLAGTRPQAAYELLRSGQQNSLAHLGPADFTKFLYFAGASNPHHPSLILDRQVATALRNEGGWSSLSPAADWSAEIYGRYCRLLMRWAVEETARRHRLVCPDEVEQWLRERESAVARVVHVPQQRC